MTVYNLVELTDDEIALLATSLWDLAALHSTYPRQHLDRLHTLRRRLLAIQVPRAGLPPWTSEGSTLLPEST